MRQQSTNWTAVGRLVRHRESGRNTVFCLDPRGNVTGVQWTDYPSGESFSETYSLSGDRLSGMTTTDGDPVPFYCDALGTKDRLHSLGDNWYKVQ